MAIRKNHRRALLSWLFLGTLFALCGVLAALQYRWIGEVSVAARERLHGSLQATLFRLSQGLNTELANTFSGLIPPSSVNDPQAAERDLVSRFEQWSAAHNRQMFRHIALAIPRKPSVQLFELDLERGSMAESAWPSEWSALKTRMESALSPPTQWDGRTRPGAPMDAGPNWQAEEFTMEAPLFAVPGSPLAARNSRGSSWI